MTHSHFVPFTRGTHRYAGSCHCGAVRFEVDVDLTAGTTLCNCNWCRKSGWWGVLVKPDAFRLLSGDEHLSDVSGQPGSARKRCARCGFESFSTGDLAELGGAFVSINVRCLDGVDLEGVPVSYLDGLHNTWAELARRPWEDPFRVARQAVAS